jgi:hypothetical protein
MMTHMSRQPEAVELENLPAEIRAECEEMKFVPDQFTNVDCGPTLLAL